MPSESGSGFVDVLVYGFGDGGVIGDSHVACVDACVSVSGVDYSGDGACDDGGSNASFYECLYGYDCSDCGPRLLMNECEDENGGCEQDCVDLLNGYQCGCNDGFALSDDGVSCEALVNECAVDNGNCEEVCVDLPIGFVCSCAQGRMMDSVTGSCIDLPVDSLCNADCQFSFDGICDDGGENADYSVCEYGSDCADCGVRVSETNCRFGNGGCSHLCINVPDGVECSCPTGFMLNADQKNCDRMPSGALCENTCRYQNDGTCDDGGEDAAYALCELGSDCNDCGLRRGPAAALSTMVDANIFVLRPSTGSTVHAVFFELSDDQFTCQAVALTGDLACFDLCVASNGESLTANGECEDGGIASASNACAFGTDCTDCGTRNRAKLHCETSCRFHNDGYCDDGGPGSGFALCDLGTDCGDCGPRLFFDPSIADPVGAICMDSANGLLDAEGEGCEAYYGSAHLCGLYDTELFSATSLCCPCGGGLSVVPASGLGDDESRLTTLGEQFADAPNETQLAELSGVYSPSDDDLKTAALFWPL